MKGTPTCPRCSAPLHAPSLWSSAWQCAVHGDVLPFQPVVRPSTELLASVAKEAAVPVWLPWPLPRGWVLTGVAHVGDDRSGSRAVAVACSGPAPLGGMGEMVIVAEEPGLGLGARYAGIEGPDPGDTPSSAPAAKVHSVGHPTALWCLPAPADRAAFVGEAQGNWLWVVLWPEAAGALLLEDLELADLRDVVSEVGLVPVGALSPRLTPT